MGRRVWQIFVSPGADNQELPIAPSPWHNEGWVHLPREHWQLIIDFAYQQDKELANLLEGLSFAPDFNENDDIHVKREILQAIIIFIKTLIEKIKIASPLVPLATEEIPDDLENTEHISMLQAVAAVFTESINLAQPFRAWRE